MRKSPYVPQKLGQSLANGYPVRRDRNEKLDAPVMLVKWYDWTTSNNPTNEINNIGFRVASS